MSARPACGMRGAASSRAYGMAAVAAAAVALAAASVDATASGGGGEAWCCPAAATAATASAAPHGQDAGNLLPAAHAQDSSDPHPPAPVVISEAEINPPGDDRRAVIEWVELHNPSALPVDVGGWSISSSDLHKRTLEIPEGTSIGAGAFRVFHHRTAWFADILTSVRLHDAGGRLVDETPRLSDSSGDLRSWSRAPGTAGANSSDWALGTATAGSSNAAAAGRGNVPGAVPADLPVAVGTDRASYELGDRIAIRGNVSEEARASVPTHANRGVSISIEGPSGYERQMSVYPDAQLRFFASVRLSAVTGAADGPYTVTASYAGSSDSASFTVGGAAAGGGSPDAGASASGPPLSISTDRGSYRPGETVVVAAAARETLPYEGLSYEVIGPDGGRVDGGRLYPDAKGRFEARVFLNPVGAAYGNHTLAATYGEAVASARFAVLGDGGDQRRAATAAVRTDRAAYAPGETVAISGSLGDRWSFALDLELRQVEVESLGRVAVNLVKHDATVRPAGDGSFSYEYRIANGTERLGEYVVRVSDTGVQAETSFRVEPQAGPEGGGRADGGPAAAAPARALPPPAASADPVTITTDRAVYEQGSRIVFSGTAIAPRSASHVANTIEITIVGASGGLASRGQIDDARGAAGSGSAVAAPVAYTLSAVPDAAGNYRVSDTLYASAYGPGTYAVHASYANNRHRAFTAFEVVDSLDIVGDASISVSKRLLAPGETAVVTGIVPGLSQGSGIDITVYKPGGDTDRYGALADRSRFAWEWEAPRTPGVYQAAIKAGPASERIFLKVSEDPASETLEIPVLSISADRASYGIGEEVVLSGLAREAGALFGGDGPPVRERAKVVVREAAAPFKVVYEYNLGPDSAGYFGTSFDLPVGVFGEGGYSVIATYDKTRAATTFRVEGGSGADRGASDLSIVVGTDRPEYRPGETVAVSGSLTRLVSVDAVEVNVAREDELQINCGTYSCGSPGSTERVRPDERGRFSRTYEIAASADAVGRYVVRATTPFATVSGAFTVVAAPDGGGGGGGESSAQGGGGAAGQAGGNGTVPGRYTESFNRIPDAVIAVPASESDVNGTVFVPRALQGLLLPAPRADPLSVDIRLFANATGAGGAEGPACVIGPAADGCLVSGSTRAPGAIYQTVQIGGTDYRVRYSGPDATPEKFAVLPAEAGTAIGIGEWTVEVERPEGEPSWFYYKLTRIAAPGSGGGTP